LLVFLSLAYASSIQRDVVRWIRGIEAAARKRSRDPDSRAAAPVNPRMPSELRSVAQAVNAMAEHAGQRQRALQTSLAENRVLMQEMHHRVKNSLQVIQSYVALIRRMEKGVDSVALTRISGSVSVLAVAYRIALTSGGIRPVPVRPFLDEVSSALFANLRRPYQNATAIFEWEGELDVDRAIPLGLGMVEAIIAGIDGARATFVTVRLCPTGEGEVELIVSADGSRADDQPSNKIMTGLAGQLGATPETRTAGDVLAWRFAP
jgi:two-component sensor histidine kinase